MSDNENILFPSIELFGLDFEEDFREKPASKWSVVKIGSLQAKIENYVHMRSSSTRRDRLHLQIPFFKIVAFANEAFGYNGWSTEILSTEVVNIDTIDCSGGDNDTRGQAAETYHSRISGNDDNNDNDNNDTEGADNHIRYNMKIKSVVKVKLKDGTYFEAEGIGKADNLPNKSMVYKKCKKESITDATKNAIFGFKNILTTHQDRLQSGYYAKTDIFDMGINKFN